MSKKLFKLILAVSMFGMAFAAPGDENKGKVEVQVSDELAYTSVYFDKLIKTFKKCSQADDNKPSTQEYKECIQARRILHAASSKPSHRANIFNTMEEVDPGLFKRKVVMVAPTNDFVKTTTKETASRVLWGTTIGVAAGFAMPYFIRWVNNEADAAGAAGGAGQ